MRLCCISCTNSVLYMKKLILLFALIILGNASIAQPLTAAEMLDMLKCKNNGCISPLLLAKDYEAGNNNESADFSVYEYYSKTSEPYDNNPLIVLPNRVEYSLTGKAYIVTVMFYTGSQHTVDGIMSDFTTKGFKPMRDTLEMVNNNNLQMEYTSTEYPNVLLILTQQKKERNEQKYTEYAFNLKQLPQTTDKTASGK